MAGGNGNADGAEVLIGEKDVPGDLFQDGFEQDDGEERQAEEARVTVGLFCGFEGANEHQTVSDAGEATKADRGKAWVEEEGNEAAE